MGPRRNARASSVRPRLGRVALVGCGHIGGSLAMALKQAGVVTEIVGSDSSPAALARALELGIIDEATHSDEDAARTADLVILAVPVRSMAGLATRLAAVVRDGTIVTDVGSTKAHVVAACQAVLGARARFVGGHPMAGTERSGPDAADPLLFDGKRVFLTPVEGTDAAALETVSAMWTEVGARVSTLTPEDHDRVMAAVSHLPHVAAYSLAAAAASGSAGPEALAGFTGKSFEHATRVAATPPAIWIDIFLENREALLPLIDDLAQRIAQLRAAIDSGDGAEIARLLVEGRSARQRILGP